MMKVLTHISNVWETKASHLTCPRILFSRGIAMVFLCGITLTIPGSIALYGQQLQPQEPATSQPAAAQPPAPGQVPTPGPATTQDATVAGATTTLLGSPAPEPPMPGEITEDYLKQLLVGKQLFLRGEYLGDSLSFNEFGDPTGTPPVGSFTLSAVQIDQVHLSKSRVELEGNRYALHFLGAMPYEDDARAVDRVKITPKKKTLHISIAREDLDKRSKESDSLKAAIAKQAAQNAATAAATAPANSQTPPPAAQQPASRPGKWHSKEKEGDTKAATSAHEATMLHDAITKVFAQGIDEKFREKLPGFWQLYFEAQAAGTDYHPADRNVLRSNTVDNQAKLLSSIAPQSNEFAQANSIAGQAIYRVVIGTDGVPGQIAVVRPIGFGLDENAVAAIRKATFAPAAKGGKPVSELLDLAVLFRIYSKQTAASGGDNASSKEIVKPGPYSAGQPAQQPAGQAPNQ
jgi:TonB family protein